ncbi:MAG TPA: hypothetical protein VHA06_21785 [Candidatus Angelobacter sp.]|nr:hypothetical protein [Candidatus Angelobacter sp.]
MRSMGQVSAAGIMGAQRVERRWTAASWLPCHNPGSVFLHLIQE